MIRYLTLTFIVLTVSANATELGDCGYTPKRTGQHVNPGWEIFEDCASYEDGVLKIAREHLTNLNFGNLDIASFYCPDQFFYVKPDGRYLSVIAYDNGADPYQEGLTRSLLEGKIAYYNLDFELVLAPGYDWAWPFENGRALVCKGCTAKPVEDGHQALTGGLWGYIDRQGEVVIPVQYKAGEVPGKTK